MKTRLFYKVIILLLLAVLISQIKGIPSFENIHALLIISVLILAFALSLRVIFKLWVRNKRDEKTSRIQQVIRTVIIITVFSLALMIAIPNFSKPELVDEITIANKTVYLYHEPCFPPDSECECDNYGSLIYIKNQYLPIIHLVLKTDFYVESVQLNNGELIAKASDICLKDIGKVKKRKLVSPAFL